MKTRIISGVLAALLIAPIYYFGGYLFKVFAIVLGLVAMREMMKLREKYKPIPTEIKGIAYLFSFFLVINSIEFAEWLPKVDFNTNLFGLILFSLFTPMVFYRDISRYSINDASFLFVSMAYISIPFNAAILLRDSSIHYLTIAVLIAVMTDVFAYFTGMFFGKHKLIPEISPKKTIEGAIGGILFATLFVVGYVLLFDTGLTVLESILITLILSPVGQIGDLVASAIKRRYSIKDFGNIMPGHGGVLDRFDNLMFVIVGLSILLDLISKIQIYG